MGKGQNLTYSHRKVLRTVIG